MKTLRELEKDLDDELKTSKTFIKTYDSSIYFKAVALYVFLLFSILISFAYIPVKYVTTLIVYRVFKTFNEITPKGDLYDYKIKSGREDIKD